jgi:hypothetical protein
VKIVRDRAYYAEDKGVFMTKDDRMKQQHGQERE